MDSRKEVSKDAVRAALQALGEGGKEISYRLVYEALGLENDAEQAVVRSRISLTTSSIVPARQRVMKPCGALSARPSRVGAYRNAP